jgi:hypothetical protein
MVFLKRRNNGMRYKLILECVDVKGFCPVYRKGSKITFCEPIIVMKETDAICVGALLAFGPFYRPLVRGISPKDLGLGEGYIACHAPPLVMPEAHGTVFFKIKQVPVEETPEDVWLKEMEKKGIRGDKEVIKREFWPEKPDKPY